MMITYLVHKYNISMTIFLGDYSKAIVENKLGQLPT